MTTSDYLTQLQQDREDLVDNLETQGITGLTGDETFTELVPEVLNISGGGGVDEYFNSHPTSINYSETASNAWGNKYYIKTENVFPPVYVPDTATNVATMFLGWTEKYVPKVYFGSQITNTYMMFKNCSNITQVDLSGSNCINITSTGEMFQGCKKLTSVNFSSLNNSSPINIYNMFYDCTSLTQINLSNVGAISDLNQTFYNCSALTKIDLRNADFTNVSSTNFTFYKVPTTCLIIVKDNTQKAWMNSHFSTLTNVQTVAEYEASLNS